MNEIQLAIIECFLKHGREKTIDLIEEACLQIGHYDSFFETLQTEILEAVKASKAAQTRTL